MRAASFFLCILVVAPTALAFAPPTTITTRHDVLLSMSQTPEPTTVLHTVDDLECRERHIQLPSVGTVTVLEATEDTQLELDQMALAVALNLNEGDDSVKLQQGDVHGASLWPSSCAVARYLVEHREELQLTSPTTTVLELGAGSGLVSLTAALQGASVVATDFEPFPLRLAEYAAQNLNRPATHNNNHNNPAPLPLKLETQVLDICRHDEPVPPADVVIAADVNYDPATAVALAHRTVQALAQGSRVIVGDQPERPGHVPFVRALTELLDTSAESIPMVETTGETLDPILEQIIELPVRIVDLKPSHLRH